MRLPTFESKSVPEFFDLIGIALRDTAASLGIYLVTFVACMIDAVFPPTPSTTIVVAAAALGFATGEPSPWAIGLLAALGGFTGDALCFALGRTIGTERFGWMRTARIQSGVAWARQRLERRGASLIFIARYVPVGHVAVHLTGGATGCPARRHLPLALLGAATWSVYSVTIGIVAGSWMRDQPLLGAALGAGIAIVLGLLVDRITAQRDERLSRAERSAEEDRPKPVRA